MLLFSVIILVSCVGTALLQLSWLRSFRHGFRCPDANRSQPEIEWPRVLVVLPLRGADPFLRACLEGLFKQNYPTCDIRIVIDSREDPAWPIVEETIEACSAKNVEVKTLDTRLETCGLKVSALIQEFRELDDQYQVAAFVDADTIPYPNWLRDLVAPLSDPSVGATSGMRWYAPTHSNLGTLVRTVWNMGAVVQMEAFGIAWGGSMAFQGRLFREPYLLSKWSKLLWEDTFTQNAMQELGLRLEFVSRGVLPNRERVSLRSCFRYMTRQMLNGRLYHNSWPVIAAYGLWVVFAPILAAVTACAAVAQDQPLAAQLCGWGLLAHLGSVILIGIVSGRTVRQTVCARGEAGWNVPPKILLAACLTPFVYCASVVKALFLKTIEWRGVRYDIRSPWEIERGQWQPYKPVSTTPESPISL